jgi:hypothetical protein
MRKENEMLRRSSDALRQVQKQLRRFARSLGMRIWCVGVSQRVSPVTHRAKDSRSGEMLCKLTVNHCTKFWLEGNPGEDQRRITARLLRQEKQRRRLSPR